MPSNQRLHCESPAQFYRNLLDNQYKISPMKCESVISENTISCFCAEFNLGNTPEQIAGGFMNNRFL